MVPLLKFTAEDYYKAYDEWGANCGPGALAALTKKTLDEVRLLIPKFEKRRYTTPAMMVTALKNAYIPYRLRKYRDWPILGLVRVQWEGPWMNQPFPAKHYHTHWIGACGYEPINVGIFDINCMESGGWVSLNDWDSVIVPWLLKNDTKATGLWHITHSIELVDGIGDMV